VLNEPENRPKIEYGKEYAKPESIP